MSMAALLLFCHSPSYHFLTPSLASASPLRQDDAIQLFLRTAFDGVSTLTIAHRLNTIMDYDSVLVLSAGSVVESGSPAELLSEKSAGAAAATAAAAAPEVAGAGAVGKGAFAMLVDSVGAGAAAHLRLMATEAAAARERCSAEGGGGGGGSGGATTLAAGSE